MQQDTSAFPFVRMDPASGSMLAVVLTAPGRCELVEQVLPEPAHGQIRVRLEGCGICASSLPLWEGRAWFSYPQPPGAPGHEGWGVVDRVGEGVSGLREGDRVAALSYRAFASHDVAAAEACVVLPSELDGQPLPGEALGCAMNIFRRSGIRAEQTVGVVGSGFLGSLLIQLATAAGARVLTVSRRPTSRETALLAGADLTLEFGEDGSQVLDRVRTLTNGRGCDVVIEATGKQAPLDLAGELAAERGRLVVAGFHQDGPRTVNMQGWNWKGLDVINAHERDPQVFVEGMRLAVDAVLEGRMDPSPLLTHAFPLERAAEALDLLRTRPEGFIKAYLHTA